MLFTTNKPLNEWGKVLLDEDMAAAILDRVLERGRFIHLDGPSGRTRHLNPEEILPAGTDRARISGINGPEFPEPTHGRHWLNFEKHQMGCNLPVSGGQFSGLNCAEPTVRNPPSTIGFNLRLHLILAFDTALPRDL
jgi:IstB-like ATP binding protein